MPNIASRFAFYSSPPTSVADSLARFAVFLALWLLATGLAWAITRYAVRWLTRQQRLEESELAVEIVRVPFLLAMVSYGILDSWQRAGVDANIGENIRRFHGSLVVLLIAYAVWNLLYRVVVASLRRRAAAGAGAAEDVLIPILSRIGPVVIILASANAVAAIFGGNLATWLTGIGLLSVAIGYVFQEPLQGLFSGTYLSLDQPFRAGDLIMLADNCLYRVQSVGVRVTELYDVTRHAIVYFPNASLAGQKLVNVVRPSVEQRCTLRITLTDPRDPRAAAALLVEACYGHENVLGEWPLKEPALRRRIAAYEARVDELLTLQGALPGKEIERQWMSRRIERLNGELIRLQIEGELRQNGEAFSKDLLHLARWASHNEHGGLDPIKRDALARHVDVLVDKFDTLVEQISTWLYLIKAIEYHLIDDSYDEPMKQFVARKSHSDERLLLAELRECGFPLVPEGPIARRSDCVADHHSDQEATRAVDREQFNDRNEFLDYQRLYSAWHQNVLKIYRELVAIRRTNQLEGSQSFRLDARIQDLERQFADDFLLNVGHWQLPTVSLTAIDDGKLTFEVVFFVDDALRDECHRVERVSTELLMEIDRARILYQSTPNDRVQKAEAVPPALN